MGDLDSEVEPDGQYRDVTLGSSAKELNDLMRLYYPKIDERNAAYRGILAVAINSGCLDGLHVYMRPGNPDLDLSDDVLRTITGE